MLSNVTEKEIEGAWIFSPGTILSQMIENGKMLTHTMTDYVYENH